MKEIRVIRSGHIWEAEHLEDGQPDAYIAELFDGHHILPTPFMTSIPVEEVCRELRRLTPGVMVTPEEEESP